MIGNNRDEGGLFTLFGGGRGPVNDDLTGAVSDLQSNEFAYLPNNTLFREGLFLPAGTYGNSTFRSLNVTSRITTDGRFRCDTQAFAHSAVKHNLMPSVYVFEFNRTYQPPGFSNFACNAPKTTARPNGDPDAEYLKCHSGSMGYMFRSNGRWLPERDGNDAKFSGLIVDYWTSFARTGNPNPNEAWLEARGYTSTIEQMDGQWKPVTSQEQNLRWLDWGAAEKTVGFQDLKQCEAIGVPLTRYEV